MRAALLLIVAAAGCTPQLSPDPPHDAAAAPEPTCETAAPPAPTAPSASAASPPPAAADGGGAPPPVLGEPRTKEYTWMPVSKWRELHEALVARARKGKVGILFLGDSLTEGWRDNAVWQGRYLRRGAANFGIGGDTVENVLWRIDHGEIDGLSPKVVVLEIGTNNLGLQGDAPADVARKIAALVGALRAKLSGTKVLLLGILPRGAAPGTEMRGRVAAVNERIAKLDDGKLVRYLDIGPKLLDPSGALSRGVSPDLLHLSEQGYAIWADAMEPLLARMLGG